MSMIQHLPNGAAIKSDVIESFVAASQLPENVEAGDNYWNFVEADMHMDLSGCYSPEYIQACFDHLVDVQYTETLISERVI